MNKIQIIVYIFIAITISLFVSGIYNLYLATDPIVIIAISVSKVIPSLLMFIMFNTLSIHGYMSQRWMERMREKQMKEKVKEELSKMWNTKEN
jgi:hypothetical protein